MAGPAHAPKQRRSAKEGDGRRHLGSTRSMKTELRSRWIIERWGESVSITPGRMKELVRKEFDCGITASEQALARAYEIMRENTDDPALVQRISAFYFENAERAQKRGELGEARKSMDSLRAHLGVGAPERVEHSEDIPGLVKKLKDLDDDELALLAKVDGEADDPE